MCNLYSLTKSQKAIIELVRAMRDPAGNFPLLPAIFPDKMAPVVRTAPDGIRGLTVMRWGFPPPTFPNQKSTRPVTNIRNRFSGHRKRAHCASSQKIPNRILGQADGPIRGVHSKWQTQKDRI